MNVNTNTTRKTVMWSSEKRKKKKKEKKDYGSFWDSNPRVSESKAVFTLGRNMISLITNETCFALKSVHIRRCVARIMIETCLFWSWLKQPHEVVSIMIRWNMLKMADTRRGGECPKDPKLGLLWDQMFTWNMADVAIKQRQLLAMVWKQNIWKSIATKHNDSG